MDKKHHDTPIADEYGCNCASSCAANTGDTRTDAEKACSKGVNLWDIANLEAGTDVHVEGVTDVAPYKNLAEYTMVSAGTDIDEDGTTVDMQGS